MDLQIERLSPSFVKAIFAENCWLRRKCAAAAPAFADVPLHPTRRGAADAKSSQQALREVGDAV